ncbi:hypothetical protein WJX73_003084 [Symbiochloris irregularis]|uniref:Thioredoxin domain-containing protein n=1 Tax=Symbiochloris irregularis TaxID=706552 RepID=A0AAW1PRK0_9CHLO
MLSQLLPSHRRVQAPVSSSIATPSVTAPRCTCGGISYVTRSLAQRSAGRRSTVRTKAVSSVSTEQETDKEAFERRVKESQRVEERVKLIASSQEFHDELEQAGKKLVVLEIDSAQVCQTGLKEEAESHWKVDKADTIGPCQELKHLLQRTARDCPDVQFVHIDADETGGDQACKDLGVDVLPTLQFWREGKKLWEHRGILHLQQDLGEGVLWYGDTAAHGLRASEYVQDLRTRAEFERYIKGTDSKVLTVVDVSLESAAPCIRIFAAVLALARSFKGYANFARLLGDANSEGQEIMQQYNVKEVPCFLFFRDGKEVGRHYGSSRGDLIGQILQQQAALGIQPPPPPVRATRPRKVGR